MDYQLFGPLLPEDYAVLKADIARRGVMVAVEMDDQGNILDGHHRIKACNELGITTWPTITRTFTTEQEKRAHVRALNLARRHLSSEQKRTTIADQLRETPEVSDRQIAERLGVSPTTVGTVRSELETTVQIGQLERTLGKDGKYRRSPHYWAEQAILEVAKGIQAERREERRAGRMEIIVQEPPSLEGLGTFHVVYADPPWHYDITVAGSRAIENQYPTMPIEEICALPVQEICADDCVLFLWATSPKLTEALQVMGAWGFTYRTCMVWVKDKIGMGYYARQQHELLLIGARGELPTPLPADRPASVVFADRTEHSVKPPEFYGIIEKMYPEFRRVELFGRETREGWSVWGNQV